MKKEYYLYVDGQKVKVSEEIYKVYWREEEHEKYLEQVDRKKHLIYPIKYRKVSSVLGEFETFLT